jgi:hypothetical protein
MSSLDLCASSACQISNSQTETRKHSSQLLVNRIYSESFAMPGNNDFVIKWNLRTCQKVEEKNALQKAERIMQP